MTNEIKEILISNIKNEIKKTKEKDFALCIEQWEQLLDYITNLQKENIKLKDLCDKYEEEHSTAFNLWKTNIIENVPALSDMQEQLEYYKSRNEKAIKEIEYFELKANHLDDDIYLDEELSNRLLNILRGEENDK